MRHILDGEPYTPPHRSAAQVIADAIRGGAADGTLEERFLAMRRDTATYVVAEAEMNRLGYYLLTQKRLRSAVSVFRLDVAAFPASANVYDSLGEAYMVSRDTARAVEN